jgi:hypothetical protein
MRCAKQHRSSCKPSVTGSTNFVMMWFSAKSCVSRVTGDVRSSTHMDGNSVSQEFGRMRLQKKRKHVNSVVIMLLSLQA